MLELLDALLGIIATGQFLKVITDKLIEALAEGVSLLSSACYKLLINRQSHVHGHSICAHVSCVKLKMIISGYALFPATLSSRVRNQPSFEPAPHRLHLDRKSTRLNSSHLVIS